MKRKDTWSLHATVDKTPKECALCERPLGERVEMHHLIPKSKGGKETVPLHPICHRKIHATFRETTLARNFATISCLRKDQEIANFIKWLDGKLPDFYRRTRQTKKR